MGWRILKGEWRRHALLWGWTALYFSWQSIVWNSTMRYQMPIYPSLAIFGAWAVIALYDLGHLHSPRGLWVKFNFPVTKVFAVFISFFVLLTTSAWAFAFTRIYTRPHTRLEASRWIFQNAPGPINLHIQTQRGIYNQPLPFSRGITIQAGEPFHTSFSAAKSGDLSNIYLPHVVDQRSSGILIVTVTTSPEGGEPLGMATVPSDEVPQISLGGDEYFISLDQSIPLMSDQTYYLNFEVQEGLEEVDVCGSIHLLIQTSDDLVDQGLSSPPDCLIEAGQPISIAFTAKSVGTLSSIALDQIVAEDTAESQIQTISVALSPQPEGEPLATAAISSDFSVSGDQRGDGYHITLERPINLVEGETYYLRFELVEGQGAIAFVGDAIANESTWDDGLPLRMDGYDPYGGIYKGGLNFEMYWDDNQDKLDRFLTTLNQADYVLITSSRQWASTSRLPERYPLTSEYYRRLLGCPADKSIEWCYNLAQPGMFKGSLGFDLVKVFQSNPSLGRWQVNDQSSEEAFTVYDHPKVFIFQKSQDYDPMYVRDVLSALDLSRVIHITPKQADSHPGDLMLPGERLVEQREGGTWSSLFDVDAPQNRLHIFGIVLWYASISIVGLLGYPLVRFALPGLSDRGYPLSRTAGMLIVSYLVWLAGSFRIPFSRLTIGVILILLALVGGILAYHQRTALKREWRERRYFFLLVEALFLGLFIVGLLIRLGNPDLWHPWKGGEKPMDFSYFNAVLKSTSFPPYDPWFAGGYINYYYYGFLFVGVLVKFLGLVPAVAYNMVLPTLFAMIAMCAFSLGWNLTQRTRPHVEQGKFTIQSSSIISAIAASLGVSILGNLGTVRMVIRGYQSIAAPLGNIDSGSVLMRFYWSIRGFIQNLTGTPLPFRLDEWYWNPSRVIASEHGSPITEFPFFTFLYADLHAHLIALPLSLLALAWMISIVLSAKEGKSNKISVGQMGAMLFLGALVVGSLFPTNTWDFYPYLALGIVAVGYAFWRSDGWRQQIAGQRMEGLKGFNRRILFAIAGVILFVTFSILLFQPYRHWYGQAYNQVEIWTGTRTPISDYITHWGLFLFVLVSWMVYESVDWMANTPMSALKKLKPYREVIYAAFVFLIVITVLLGVNIQGDETKPNKLPLGIGVSIAWWVLPLAAWAGVLLLRPNITETKRIILFLFGTALTLSLMVEIIVLRGDVGRMNTVFKFYLVAWILFSVSSAAALGWLWRAFPGWDFRWRTGWQVILVFLVASAALYPFLASVAKIKDRMVEDAPHTLNGMTFMKYATYHDLNTALDLERDYEAIRWMQENIEGSPVIVEANMVEYHWGTRYTIYTGLPGVVGWNWHQRQQRAVVQDTWVFNRVEDVHSFYQTTDLRHAEDFLRTYDVRYIILGQLERAKYPGPGLEKFSTQEGILWHSVYQDQDTNIYEVLEFD
jgi:YYY domain-containing protein